MNDIQASRLVEVVSNFAFPETVEKLVHAIEKAGMDVFAQIDHAKGAHDNGLTMPPTLVLVYGHPKGGTPMMLSAPQSALDLPLRLLVRETEDGRTLVSFHPIAKLMRDAGVPDTIAASLEPAQHLIEKAIVE